MDMYDMVAKEFYNRYVGGKFKQETYDIVYTYVKFIIDTYEDVFWEIAGGSDE